LAEIGMDKKHQVFISSTFSDLKDERQAAVEAILTAGHIPAGMELFAAGDESQMEVIKRWINDSDIYMLILGGRYGSIDLQTGLSYTELEYDYAVSLNKPFFALVLKEPAIEAKAKALKIDEHSKEDAIKYDAFRKKVLSKISKLVEDSKDIKIGVLESIKSFSGRNLHGWVRSDQLPDVSPLLTQLKALSTENSTLKDNLKNTPVTSIEDFELAELKDYVDISINYNPTGLLHDETNTSFKLSWEKIFGLIAPKLMSAQTDTNMKKYIGSQILDLEDKNYKYQTLSEQNFQTIKIQFKALNLINVKYSKTVSGGADLFWELTQLGEKTMLMLRTVKK
jgi:Domain of unknown function (DUF4062)